MKLNLLGSMQMLSVEIWLVSLDFQVPEKYSYSHFVITVLFRICLSETHIVVVSPGKTKRGELSIFPRSFTVLSHCLHMLPRADNAQLKVGLNFIVVNM